LQRVSQASRGGTHLTGDPTGVAAATDIDMKKTRNALLETVVISATGLVIGLTANAFHVDGVRLARDYFPKHDPASQPSYTQTVASQPAGTGDTRPSHGTPSDPLPDELAKAIDHIHSQGLQVANHDEVVALFQDPLYEGGLYVLVDARDTQNYVSGHIPDAYQLDHYRLDRYIDEVLPICQTAMKIIVYCNGGACEDSGFTATELLNRGIDPSHVFVYAGGMDMWIAEGLPTERGERGSGDIGQGRR